jgi:hypothetical protein
VIRVKECPFHTLPASETRLDLRSGDTSVGGIALERQYAERYSRVVLRAVNGKVELLFRGVYYSISNPVVVPRAWLEKV